MLLKNILPAELVKQSIDTIDNNYHNAIAIGKSQIDTQITNEDTISFLNILPDIHEYIKPKLEDHFKVKLKKTNDFGRIYTKNAILRNHRDQWHCEYSITINLLNDPEGSVWPFMTQKSKDNEWTVYEMTPGDGVVYKGTELFHKRDELLYNECYQWFFHFIEVGGQYDNEEFYNKKYRSQ